MSKFGDAFKALGKKEVEDNEIKPEEIPLPPEPTETQQVELNAAQAEEENLINSVMEINFITPQDVANLPETELRAIEINLQAAILKELKAKK